MLLRFLLQFRDNSTGILQGYLINRYNRRYPFHIFLINLSGFNKCMSSDKSTYEMYILV